MYFSLPCDFLNASSRWLYRKSIAHNTYNMQNTCELTVDVLGKASGQQSAVNN